MTQRFSIKSIISPLASLALLVSSLPAHSVVVVNERSLIQLARESKDLASQQAHLSAKRVELDRREFQDRFEFQGVASGGYLKTSELALNDFAPVFSPIKSWSAGVQKATRYGLSSSLKVGVETYTDEATDPSSNRYKQRQGLVQWQIQADLFKDFLGRSTRAQEKLIEGSEYRASLQKKMDLHSASLSLRKIYWSLVANKLSYDISAGLLQTAKRQKKNAQSRFRQSVADRAEVALYSSQVASRRASLSALEFQREELFRSLTTMIPTWAGEDLELKVVNLDQIQKDLLMCTEMISQRPAPPLEFTYYDEMMISLENDLKSKRVLSRSYSQVDVQLDTIFQRQGLSGESTSDSFDDTFNENREGFQTALSVVIPLGKRGKTRNLQEEYDRLLTKVQVTNWQAELKSRFSSVVKSIQYLMETVRLEEENRKQLKIRVGQLQKKFKQARISDSDLISDQEQLLNSELSVIDIKLQIINTLFDYFSIFPETPCAFNQMKGVS